VTVNHRRPTTQLFGLVLRDLELVRLGPHQRQSARGIHAGIRVYALSHDVLQGDRIASGGGGNHDPFLISEMALDFRSLQILG
jgi:hypothetical protein